MTLRLPEERVRELYERWRRGESQHRVAESAVEDVRATPYGERAGRVVAHPRPALTTTLKGQHHG